jgi:hypothetical protein
MWTLIKDGGVKDTTKSINDTNDALAWLIS